MLYFEKYIVIDPGATTFDINAVISEEEYRTALEQFGDNSFRAEMGAEAIKEILVNLDLDLESQRLRIALKETSSDIKSKKLLKKLNMVCCVVLDIY